MRRKKQQEKLEKQYNDLQEPQYNILKKQTLKELIAPAGIDASHIDHLEIIYE